MFVGTGVANHARSQLVAVIHVTKHPRKYSDIVLLYQCVNEFITANGLKNKMPKENELVVHIRAGDKLKLHEEYSLERILKSIRQSLKQLRLKHKCDNNCL